MSLPSNVQPQTIGDVVQQLQNYKFTSPNWKLPEIDGHWPVISYELHLEVTFLAGGDTPLHVTIRVQESKDGEENYGYQIVGYVTRIPVQDMYDALKLVFPEYKLEKSLEPYVHTDR